MSATQLCEARRQPRRQPLERAGIHARVEAARVLEALKADVDLLAEMATPEQKQMLHGTDAPNIRDEAVWEATPAGQQARRDENKRIRQQYAQVWGEEPGEFS